MAEHSSYTAGRYDARTRVSAYSSLGTPELYELPVHGCDAYPQTIRHIASFELPELWDAQSGLRVQAHCSEATTSATLYQQAYKRPAKIYEPNPGNCLVGVHISTTAYGYFEEWMAGTGCIARELYSYPLRPFWIRWLKGL